MNWSYIGIEALLPLVWALAATFLGGALWALHLHRGGGSSRVALGRFLRALALIFPLAFILASGWEARHVLRGFAGLVLHRPVDQRAMGLLRLQGEGFLNADPLAAATWFRRAAVQGDAPSQLHLARALASGRGTTTNPEEALHWAEASAQQGAPEAMLLAGDLWQARDSAKAKAWHVQAMNGLQPALHQREPQACLTYGQMRQAGKGLPADPVEGLAWMKVAEARGLPGLQTITIRMTEGQLTPAQREAADLRARALLSPP